MKRRVTAKDRKPKAKRLDPVPHKDVIVAVPNTPTPVKEEKIKQKSWLSRIFFG